MVFKAFVANLGKYKEGELIGEWVEFPADEDEFDEVLERIGVGLDFDKRYWDYFFSDYEYVDCPDFRFGENENFLTLNEVAEKIEDFDKWDMDKLHAIVEAWGTYEVLNYLDDFDIDDFNLYTDIEDEHDLGRYWVEESGCYDLKTLGNLANYIDYEKFGRDIYLENNGSFTSYGYIERL